MPDSESTPRSSPARSIGVPAVLFALALGLQVGILVTKVAIPRLQELATVRGMSALDRSATLAFGDEFAAYMIFLRETVPPGAQVVVPPMAKDPVLGNIGLMQYFEVVASTGFKLIIPQEVGQNAPPSAEELRLLREEIDPEKLYI